MSRLLRPSCPDIFHRWHKILAPALKIIEISLAILLTKSL
jgi:hypothetical protein